MTSRTRSRLAADRVKDLGISPQTALLSINPARELISRWHGTRGPPFGENGPRARKPAYFRFMDRVHRERERIKLPPLLLSVNPPSEIRNVLLSGANVTYVYIEVAMPMMPRLGENYIHFV